MANNLYEYYTGQGKALPSVADRQGIATSAGIQNYTGNAKQNAAPIKLLTKTYFTLPNGGGTPVQTPVTMQHLQEHESPETIAARKAIEDSFNNPIDSNKIYQDTLTRFQSQIDNLNSVLCKSITTSKTNRSRTRPKLLLSTQRAARKFRF